MKTRPEQGFTLIELMIAMMILAFIALAIYQNTSQSYILRDKLETDGDFYNSVRVALDIMSRDIVQIYSPQSGALPGNIGKAENPASGGQGGNPGTGYASTSFGSGRPQDFWNQPINLTGVRPSRFQGESQRMSFIANSHMRIYKDSLECEFSKITYALEEDKLAEKGSLALVKTEDSDAFSDREHSDAEVKYTLLNNVKNIKFQFLDGEKDTWFSKWDTANSDRLNTFPAVIEIELEVYTPAATTSQTRNTFKIKQRYRPELPI